GIRCFHVTGVQTCALPIYLPARVACIVPRVDGRGGGSGDAHAFDPDKTLSPKEQRRIEDFILYAIAAADEAVEDSGWKPEDDDRSEERRVGRERVRRRGWL